MQSRFPRFSVAYKVLSSLAHQGKLREGAQGHVDKISVFLPSSPSLLPVSPSSPSPSLWDGSPALKFSTAARPTCHYFEDGLL